MAVFAGTVPERLRKPAVVSGSGAFAERRSGAFDGARPDCAQGFSLWRTERAFE